MLDTSAAEDRNARGALHYQPLGGVRTYGCGLQSMRPGTVFEQFVEYEKWTVTIMKLTGALACVMGEYRLCENEFFYNSAAVDASIENEFVLPTFGLGHRSYLQQKDANGVDSPIAPVLCEHMLRNGPGSAHMTAGFPGACSNRHSWGVNTVVAMPIHQPHFDSVSLKGVIVFYLPQCVEQGDLHSLKGLLKATALGLQHC